LPNRRLGGLCRSGCEWRGECGLPGLVRLEPRGVARVHWPVARGRWSVEVDVGWRLLEFE
jgi:hypothetical protein